MDIFKSTISLSKDMDTDASVRGRAARNIEFLARAIVNKMDFPAKMIAQSNNKLSKIDEQRENWLEDNGFDSEREALEGRIADNFAVLAQWASALQDVCDDEEKVSELINSRILWRIESYSTPYHSEEKIKQWVETGETREEAIETLNQIAKNYGNDWDDMSSPIKQTMLEAYTNEYVDDRPKELVSVCTERLKAMLNNYLIRYPSLDNKGFRVEAETILAAAQA